MTPVRTVLALAALTASALLPATAQAAPAPLGFSGQATDTAELSGLGFDHAFTNLGTWTATGALSGSFNVSEQTWLSGFSVHCVDTLTPVTGEAGAITVGVNAKFVGSTTQYGYFSGTWTITSGTGAYANLTGNGEYTGVIDRFAQPRTITETLTGHGS